ncbi:MAG: CehA/McbA family metallohydrolase, partial [Ruminococcus sp.]|nr:CehA/McbA family metallohydrolase [Candidatus Apopatosoma intestinale]
VNIGKWGILMNMKIKFVSFHLASLMVLTAFVGCSPANGNVDQTPAAPAGVTVRAGNVRGKVLSGNGDMMIAGIIIVDEENNAYRATTNAYGGYHLELAPGKYTLTFTKGFEFDTYTTTVEVESLKTYYLRDVRLNQLTDSYKTGWIAGDLHQHSTYSDGADSISDLAVANASMGMYWGFLTDHNTSRGVPEWRETSSVNVLTDVSGNKRTFLGMAGSEVTTEFGHFQSIGTGMTYDKYEINLTDAERSSTDKNKFAREKIVYIAEQIRLQNGIAQINHPYSITNMGAMNFLDKTDFDLFENFDTIEIWNAYFTVPDGRFTLENSDNQNYQAKMLWYSTLNNVKNGGKFIAATNGTDNHDSSGYASGATRNAFVETFSKLSEYQNYCRYAGKYSGCIATYAYLGDKDISQENILDAVKNGHSYLTNGPILNLTANGAIFGETADAENGELVFRGTVDCRDGMETIRFVVNGTTVKEVAVNASSYSEDMTVSSLVSGDWVLVEVLGAKGIYAISNPIFIR